MRSPLSIFVQLDLTTPVTQAPMAGVAMGQMAAAIGIDAVGARGWEAGGHRGCFDENADDDQHGTFTPTRTLAQGHGLPAVAAAGIMDGAGIRAALNA